MSNVSRLPLKKTGIQSDDVFSILQYVNCSGADDIRAGAQRLYKNDSYLCFYPIELLHTTLSALHQSLDKRFLSRQYILKWQHCQMMFE